MSPKEVRKKVLEVLYENRSEFYVATKKLLDLVDTTEEILDTEIRYLEEKFLLKIPGGRYMGQQYLNFPGVKITAYGIDLVEDPEEFNKLFSININAFGSVNNSNLAIGKNDSKQTIGIIDEGTGTIWNNIETEGFNIGFKNKGKNNKIFNYKSAGAELKKIEKLSKDENRGSKKWHTTPWGILTLTVIGGIIIGGIVYFLGWN